MFHLTLFGGTEGEIIPSGFTALTLFGGADLRRPTLASQLLHLKNRKERKRSLWTRLMGSDENLILTLFGCTVVQAPTLVEEFSALTGVLRSGALSGKECGALIDQLAAEGSERSPCRTLTLFGACVTKRPSVNKERKALDAAVKNGLVSDAERHALSRIAESPTPARLRALGQLAGAAG